MASLGLFLFDAIEEGLVLHVDSCMLVSDRIDHLALAMCTHHFNRVSLIEWTTSIGSLRHVQSVILIEPADRRGLNPCGRFWLDFGCGL